MVTYLVDQLPKAGRLASCHMAKTKIFPYGWGIWTHPLVLQVRRIAKAFIRRFTEEEHLR